MGYKHYISVSYSVLPLKSSILPFIFWKDFSVLKDFQFISQNVTFRLLEFCLLYRFQKVSQKSYSKKLKTKSIHYLNIKTPRETIFLKVNISTNFHFFWLFAKQQLHVFSTCLTIPLLIEWTIICAQLKKLVAKYPILVPFTHHFVHFEGFRNWCCAFHPFWFLQHFLTC